MKRTVLHTLFGEAVPGDLAQSPPRQCWRGWCAATLGSSTVLVALLLLTISTAVQAHEEAPAPVMARLPACRVAATSCSYADLSRRSWGNVRSFPNPSSVPTTPLALDELQIVDPLQPLSNIPCTNGFADIYPCRNVDLLAFMPVSVFGDVDGNTLWGWVDPQTHHEYVIAGVRNGTAFVDITDPLAPRDLGKLPTRTGVSAWRDMKVYANYAFIGSDWNNAHGMQVFDLTRLRTLTATTPVTFTADALYDGFQRSHNLVIDGDSGFLYAAGTDTCSGGLHMVDIHNPTSPQAAGCYATDGYIHDAECVIYHGPDTAHSGRELCFNASANKLTVADVTDKAAPIHLSTTIWAGLGYVHQGWLTADQRYLILDDEFDERYFNHNARTYVFDMLDVDAPVLVGYHEAANPAIDHNLYISGTLVYEANYSSGLRILQMGDLGRAQLREVGFFDTYPGSDAAEFIGAWSPYPFFPSGVVAVNTIDRGLFLLRPQITLQPFEEWELFLPVVGNTP